MVNENSGTEPRMASSKGLKAWWARRNYTTRLTLTFGLIAVMAGIVSMGVLSFVWEQHFQTYTRENIQTTANYTAERIASAYEEALWASADPWGEATLAPAESASESYQGMGILVVDSLGNVKYDSSVTTSSNKVSLLPGSSAQVASANIVVDNVAVGSVRIWVYGSDSLLRQSDVTFRNNSYRAMLIAMLVSIVLASCIGYLFARNLVRPINRMAKTAEEIKEGNLSARTGMQGPDEISQLGQTFDEMADAVENDRNLERRLTTDVAHELRTPLMAIQSTVEAMADGVFEADEEHLNTVSSEVQRLSRMVNSMLKLSRLENRANPMKEEVLDVGELVSTIVSTHEAYVSDSGLTLHFEKADNVKIKGDPDLVRQATANLISNAVRYTPEGGDIWVKVSRGDIMANIQVKDTGIGLSPEEAKMVFNRFWRAEGGRNRENGGLGIGLSVVKEIVERHNGWVQVEGRKNEGACFTIHIPLYEEPKSKDTKGNGKNNNKNGAKTGALPVKIQLPTRKK